jgi:hypothetical protein
LAERIGWGNQGRYWMPPASSCELRSDASSGGEIIVQRPAIFKSLCPARSALVSHVGELRPRHTRSNDINAGAIQVLGQGVLLVGARQYSLNSADVGQRG